jgi:uncharacterized membrane protein (UPF0127 family)
MRKIATWPPGVGTVTDTSFIDPKGDSDKDMIQDTQVHPDAFVTPKSIMEDQQEEVAGYYEEGVLSPVDGVDYEVSLAYDDMTDKADIEVKDEENNIIASFSCNIAKSTQEQVAGLQTYPTLKESAGLLFPYKKAQDVIYHMGTVKYSIDILFIDKEDNIKKIYKNIQPGTLGTFGCASVKHVLEICGGLSDRLGISKNNKVKVLNSSKSHLSSLKSISKMSEDLNINKDMIIKYSKIGKTRFNNWHDYPILTINNGSLNKTASDQKLITSLVSEFTSNDDIKVYAFDFDGLIEESPTVRVYKTSDLIDDDIPYIKIDGHTVGIEKTEAGNEIYRDVHLYELAKGGINNDEAIIMSLNKSFSSFITNPEVLKDAIDIFSEVKKASNDKDARIIFLTRSPNPDYIRNIVCSRINLEFGDRYGLRNIEAMELKEESDASDIIEILRDRFGNKDIKIYSDKSLLKRAGVPVPDDTKLKAKRAYKYLDIAERTLEKSIENMQANLSEYEKIKDNPEAIENSKGQYNQSVKAQTKIVKDYLVKTREAIRIFNDIKDISTTFEIIDSLASSAKTTSEGAEEVFNLIDKLVNSDFHMLLTEKTEQYAALSLDFKSSIDRAKQYINTEILGLVVLSS